MQYVTPCETKRRLKAETLETAAQILRILAHPQRLRIIEILEREFHVPVHAIVKETGFPQAVVSLHLSHMRRIGLLTAKRRGKEVWYSILDTRALSILNCICINSTADDFIPESECSNL